MEYFTITIDGHFRFEPYHDVSGYEVSMTQTKDFESFLTEERKQAAIDQAREVMEKVALSLKDGLYNTIERTIDGNTIRVVYFYSIGD